MPINVPDGLPAKGILDDERIFALEENVAARQHIRPLNVCLLNLMPKKIETETQILRLISKSALQVNLDFMCVGSHESRNTSRDHLVKFYDTFDNLADRRYDGLIVTGAPVEHLEFEDVDYWDELARIIEWSHSHVYSTLYICWGALAGLHCNYGIAKRMLPSKLFGVFKTRLCDEYNFLTNGFDEVFRMPHSRHAGFDIVGLGQQVLRHRLQILADSPVTGPSIVATPDMREIYITGHLEYGKHTLAEEYERDLAAGKPIEMPRNYYPDDDPGKEPLFKWRSAANLLYRNWVNYVYQMTPFNLDDLTPEYHGYRCEERIWYPGARDGVRDA